MSVAPGSFVYSVQVKVKCAFKLRKIEIHISRRDKKFFVLHCYYIDWDGKRFDRALHIVAITLFDGSAGQSDLPAYPLEYHPTKALIKQELIGRGQKFESYAGVLYWAYEGVAVDNTDQEPHYMRFLHGSQPMFD